MCKSYQWQQWTSRLDKYLVCLLMDSTTIDDSSRDTGGLVDGNEQPTWLCLSSVVRLVSCYFDMSSNQCVVKQSRLARFDFVWGFNLLLKRPTAWLRFSEAQISPCLVLKNVFLGYSEWYEKQWKQTSARNILLVCVSRSV